MCTYSSRWKTHRRNVNAGGKTQPGPTAQRARRSHTCFVRGDLVGIGAFVLGANSEDEYPRGTVPIAGGTRLSYPWLERAEKSSQPTTRRQTPQVPPSTFSLGGLAAHEFFGGSPSRSELTSKITFTRRTTDPHAGFGLRMPRVSGGAAGRARRRRGDGWNGCRSSCHF